MKILPVLAFLLLGLWPSLQAQYYTPQNKVWAMNRYTGLDFSNGAPQAISTGMFGEVYYEEGCASVSDEAAHLLFYSNGTRIWNANGNYMPHGIDLCGATFYNTASSTQSAVIVPDPGNKNRYYVFCLTAFLNTSPKLFCNVVDMTLDNGLGDVDTTFALRGIILEDSLTEKMVAVNGCNNGIWLLVRQYEQGNYLAYGITASGINLTPVVSSASNFPLAYYGFGVMKINHAGNRLLVCNFNGGLEYCRFDQATGIVSDPQSLDGLTGYYGGVFSPNDSKVYVTKSPYDLVYQFDLNATYPATSEIVVGSAPIEDLKLGPDGKIYMGSIIGNGTYGSRYISRINFPNNAGPACGFQDTVPGLNFQAVASILGGLKAGLPAEVIVPESRTSPVKMDSVFCHFPGSVTLNALPGFGNYLWDDGSTAAFRAVTQRGTYWVQYGNTGCSMIQTDSFRLKGEELPSLQLVFQDSTLYTTQGFASYRWYKNGEVISGATDSSLAITGNGLYALVAGNAWGCSDSAVYQVGPTGIHNLAYLKNRISVYPNPAAHMLKIDTPVPLRLCLVNTAGKLLLEARHSRELDISALAAGLYFLKIMDEQGHLVKTEKVIKQKTE